MTQEEVLKELRSVIADNQHFTTWTVSTPHLVELVNRVVLREREACAKVCGKFADEALLCGDEDAVMCFEQAEDAIRARGEA
jgi:hypothetical protein